IDGCPGALSLTSRPEGRRIGDEGVYFANRWLPVRLPLAETLRVWPRDQAPADLLASFEAPEGHCVFARHDMRLLGIPYLTIDYLLVRRVA
ncbi:MAG: hypothetical protein GY722_10570, partial [bacterium]|nr:hypothetical protein [bacterium]